MVETRFKHTEIGIIPEDWEVTIIGNTLKIKHGKSQKEVEDFKGEYPIYGTGGIIGHANKFLYNKPSVLIGRKGTIDKPRYLETPFWSVDTLFYSEILNKNCPRFLFYIFNTIKWYNYNEASGVPSLNARTIENIQIPLPPLSEQQAIAESLAHIDEWVESLEKLIAKKRLIKQGAMQKLLAPKEDWKVQKLGDIADIIGGGTPSTFDSDFWNGDINWFTPTEVGAKKYLNDSNRKITLVGLQKSSATILPIGTILLTTRAGIGDLGILTTPSATNQGFQSFLVKKGVSNEFIYYLLCTLKGELLNNASGSTFLEISPNKLKAIEVKVPSHSEQLNIATILSDMDREIESLEQKLTKAGQIKQGMMQELLTGRIRLVETVKTEKPKANKGHNEHINDAVLIGTMAACFGSVQIPMTRFKYTKVSYLLKRYKEEKDNGYLKKAAGPYKPQTRYGGAEKIALQNKYVVSQQAIYKEKAYEGFVAGEEVEKAITYFKEWYGEEAMEWISKFKFEKNDNLELWATVDMAIQDLKKENKLVNVATVKQVIQENKEWKDKLKRTAFSDDNIHNAIIKMDTLFS